MKNIINFAAMLTAVIINVSCSNDDTMTLDQVISNAYGDTIYVNYEGNSVSLAGKNAAFATASGAHVTITDSLRENYLVIKLSGSTSNGSLTVFRSKKYEIVMNGVNITNPTGPAINNQCKKSLWITTLKGTTNTLTDGTNYTESATIQQKGTLFSEGQMYFSGSGTLNVNGNCKNAIACDDYIVINTPQTINIASTAGNGIKANDGFTISDGVLTINVSADGGKGIKSDDITEIIGGTIDITTTGGSKYDAELADYSSAAGIKSDSTLTMSGGTLTIHSYGEGGKGINCDHDIVFSGGTLYAETTGDKIYSAPKAVKSDTAITISGGSFTARSADSWACSIGEDNTFPNIVGTPTTRTETKKEYIIIY